jgi:hypothetical protein
MYAFENISVGEQPFAVLLRTLNAIEIKDMYHWLHENVCGAVYGATWKKDDIIWRREITWKEVDLKETNLAAPDGGNYHPFFLYFELERDAVLLKLAWG